MNNEIQPFEFEGNKVRALADGDEVMFVASDIAKILGYRDAAALTRTLDDEEKGTRPIGTHGGTQTMTVISEPGLYKAILQRQTGRMEVEVTREFVKRFQRWVTHEVLPSIRRTGGYIPAGDADSDEDIMARARRAEDHRTQEPAASGQGCADQGTGAESAVRGRGGRKRRNLPDRGTREDATSERFEHRPEPTVRDPPRRRLLVQIPLELEHANAEGHGTRPVPNQGDGHHPLGRPRDHQPHGESNRQRPNILHRPLLPA